MAARKIKNQPATLEGSPVAIYYDSDYQEYQVKIKGQPDATYFTDDKNDAISTAQLMRNNLLRYNPAKRSAPKRKTSARTQSAAEAYVRRPSQITKKAPSDRLKKRRMVNLQSPRGVFPNPIPKRYDVLSDKESKSFSTLNGAKNYFSKIHESYNPFIFDRKINKKIIGKGVRKNPVAREKITGLKNFIVMESAFSDTTGFKTVAVFAKVDESFEYAKARDAKNRSEGKRRWIKVLEG